MKEMIYKELFDQAIISNWDGVMAIYRKIPTDGSGDVSVKITSSGETALHLAVSNGDHTILKKLLDALGSNAKAAIETKNELGNTPLHLAAAMGNIGMCKCIADVDVDKHLVKQRNNDGHTPLFLTVLYGKMEAFVFLLRYGPEAIKTEDIKNDHRAQSGETILHTAINGEHFKFALYIMNKYEDLMSIKDERGWTPLHLLARKPSVFRSCTYFSWLENILYSCIIVKKLPDPIPPDQINNQAGQQSRNTESPRDPWFPPNYGKCCYVLNIICSVLLVIFGWGKQVSSSRANGENEKKRGQVEDAENPKEELEDESLCIPCFRPSGDNGDNAKRHGRTGLAGNAKELPQDSGGDQLKFPPNYRTGFELMKLVYRLMLIILGLGFREKEKIKHIKQKHVWSLQMVEKMLKSTSIYDYDAGGRSGSTSDLKKNADATHESSPVETIKNDKNDKNDDAKQETKLDRQETPILTAASNGIKEIVELILKHFPVAIHDKNAQKKNIVLLAAQNRQPHLFDLFKQKKIPDSVYHAVDLEGNSALHLAANYNVSPHPWTIPGAALQMQWEIKWYEYVKNCVGPNSLILYNNKGQTAMEIFTETHKKLMIEGGKWLLKTSDSCSVVAALIATVAFAASATVPGSTEKGKPILEKDLAFQVFSISSLVSLCFSVTSLIMFLSILTSRYQMGEFNMALPKKLLWGMSSLLISIAAVLVSFCTGHFFILNDQLRSVAVPIYAVTCLPAVLFALGQLPLYSDLICAIFTTFPEALYNGRFAGKLGR